MRMNYRVLCCAIALFVSSVSSVFVHDAFVKDWVNYRYGRIEKFDITSNESVIAITDTEKLVKLDLGEDVKLNWSYNLRDLPNPIQDYKLVNHGKMIYGYSHSSNQVYLWEGETGVLVEVFKLENTPIKFEIFFNKGILALETNGDLQLLHTDGRISSLVYKQPVKDFKFSQYNGVGYVLTDDNSVVSISNNGDIQVFTESVPAFNKVAAFAEGFIITSDNTFYNIEDVTKITQIPFKLKNVVIVNENYFLDYDRTNINLYLRDKFSAEKIWTHKLDDPIEDLKVTEYALSTLIIVSTSSKKIAFDLTDALAADDSDLIQKHVYEVSGPHNIKFNIQESSLEAVSGSVDEGILSLSSYSFASRNTTSRKFPLHQNPLGSSSRAILVNKPQSQKSIDKAHHLLENTSSLNLIASWLRRAKGHLAELGKYIVDSVRGSSSDVNDSVDEDRYGFSKLLIFVEPDNDHITALDTTNGKVLWRAWLHTPNEKPVELFDMNGHLYAIFTDSITELRVRDGYTTSKYKFGSDIVKVFSLKIESKEFEDEPELEPVALGIKLASSSELEIISDAADYIISSDQFIVDEVADNTLQGYKVSDNKLIPTWKFTPKDSTIIGMTGRPEHSTTSSIGISRSDKSVLYKYLNPNLISVITKHDSSLQVSLHLIDAITGATLYTHTHEDEVLDFNSINLIEDDNWIIYAYQLQSPRFEQRLVVIDLFHTYDDAIIGSASQEHQKHEKLSTLSSEYNTTIDSVSSKSFVFPERILSMAPTQTKFGITLKSIVVFTESGSLIEIPKFILNSRRIDDRVVTQQDMQDEFRIMPYEPVIFKNSYQVLNHKLRLLVGDDEQHQQILIKPTELESTLAVCFVNKENEFCTLIQPSLSYDLLSNTFDKFKLSLTIVALLVAYLVTKPIVHSRKLNAAWIDRA